MKCDICPRQCNINNGALFCNKASSIKIARAALHHFEEPVISGQNGSGAVFFCGCNLKCRFCQNYEISSNDFGYEVDNNKLISIFNDLKNKGAHNINLVTPTHYTKQLLPILEQDFSLPIIWNSNGYENKQTIKLLKNKIDVFLPDLKYIDNDLSLNLSGAKDYFLIATSAIYEMLKIAPKPVIENNLIKSGVIVRHLVLPGFIDNTLKIIDYFAENYKQNALFSLMMQYVPIKEQKEPSLNRRVSFKEYNTVLEHLYKRDIKEGFVQSLSSASKKYIPIFDGEGVIK